MYFVVILRLKDGLRKNICVPIHWCMGIDMQDVYNGGIDKCRDLVVFHSKVRSRLPNFTLAIRDEFVAEDACYIGRYKTCEKTMYAARLYVNKARTILPVRYAPRKKAAKVPSRRRLGNESILFEVQTDRASHLSENATTSQHLTGLQNKTNSPHENTSDNEYLSANATTSHHTTGHQNVTVLTHENISDNEYYETDNDMPICSEPENDLYQIQSDHSTHLSESKAETDYMTDDDDEPITNNNSQVEAIQSPSSSSQTGLVLSTPNQLNDNDDVNRIEHAKNSLICPATGVSNVELDDIQNILVEEIEIEFEQVEIFPLPITGNDGIKDEPINDTEEIEAVKQPHPLFGNLIFETEDGTGHALFNGIELRAHLVSLLSMQNSNSNNNIFTDKKFIFMLMMELFSVNEMVNVSGIEELSSQKISAIEELFKIRIGTESNRGELLPKYINDACTYFKAKK